MKHEILIASLAFLATASIAPSQLQLQPGTYLVGSQGWVDTLPDPRLDTVQVVDPYAKTATLLTIIGIPTGEFPSAFIVVSPVAFLMGTKVAAAPAAGNVYNVTRSNGTWQANKLNTTPLAINVGGMVVDSGHVYVAGSAIYGPGGNDAQTRKIARANGAVTLHSQFGEDFTKNGKGAFGTCGGALVLIGKTLHIFTWNSGAPPADTRNQHWTVTTDDNPTIQKVGADLPLSKRFAGHGFAASSAVLDPVSGEIVVVGRWGELQWRKPDGTNTRFEQFPGPIDFTTNAYYSELFRAATVNTDTNALAFGDHHEHSFGTTAIDERRCNGASPNAPFANDVVSLTFPTIAGAVVSTVTALTYVPTYSTFHPVGDGCKESTGAVPCSYVSSPPFAGNPDFTFTLTTSGTSAFLFAGTRMDFDWGPLGAPGCSSYVDPHFMAGVTPVGGVASFKIPLPANTAGAGGIAQWLVLDPKANALGWSLSAGREVQIR